MSELLGAIARNALVVAAALAVCLGGAVLAARAQDDRYEARATVLVDVDEGRTDFGTAEALRSVWLPTIAEVVSSRGFRSTVARAMEPRVPASRIELAGVAEGLLLRIVARADDPALARRAADAAAAAIPAQPVVRGFRLTRVEGAATPTEPAGPGLPVFLVAGAALGIVGGVLLALLVDGWRRQPRSGPRARPRPHSTAEPAAAGPTHASAEPARRSRPPILGEIPGSAALAAGGPLRLRDPEQAVLDAFERLSRELERAAGGDTVIAIAPVAGGDGASTVAAGLGLTLAGRGVPVTVVDADLARPALHECFGLASSPGLADLAHGATPPELIRPSGSDGLSVVSAGRANGADPAGVAAASLPALLAALAGRVVLVDVPPLVGGHGGTVASGLRSPVVVVVDAPRLGTQTLDSALAAAAAGGAGVLGVVVNHATAAVPAR